METSKHNRLWLILVIVLVILVVGGLVFYLTKKRSNSSAAQPAKNTNAWQESGVAISGRFADAEVVDLGNGQYRMYYSVEPEVPNNKLEVFSALSSDGKTWDKEEGTRKEFATFTDVVKLSSGQFRMYFQNAQVIKSAISTDGLNFTDEPGERIDKTETGFSLENVGAGSTVQLEDGTFMMAYRGTINEPYQGEKVPNQNTQVYFYATSADGLSFTKKGLALDSRNDTLKGLSDGAEFVKWDNGELRLFFWSYSAIYHLTFNNEAFSKEPVFDFTNNKDTTKQFSENPPGDPTLVKIDGKWFMYYGQHTKGIYYANYLSR